MKNAQLGMEPDRCEMDPAIISHRELIDKLDAIFALLVTRLPPAAPAATTCATAYTADPFLSS